MCKAILIALYILVGINLLKLYKVWSLEDRVEALEKRKPEPLGVIWQIPPEQIIEKDDQIILPPHPHA